MELLEHRVEHGLQLDLGEDVVVSKVIELVEQAVAITHGVEPSDGERVDHDGRPLGDAESTATAPVPAGFTVS